MIKDEIRRLARELGFAQTGFTDASGDAQWGDDLDAWLDQGRHGQMDWMETHRERRRTPQSLWPEARSVITLALPYRPDGDPLAALAHRDRGVISVYAKGADYHDLMKRRLKQLAGQIIAAWGAEVKVFVDTAPVLEKPLAARSGLGWQGKHTNLVSRRLGNWFFLGEIFTTLDLEPDAPHRDCCGSCDACHRICPTGALGADGIDARLCVSYLTIEHKGPIPRALRPLIGNRIYGCDDCLAICPWNKFGSVKGDPAFTPRAELQLPRLGDLAGLDDAAFRQVFQGSPIKRVGRDRFVRNVLIAIGNSGLADLYGAAARLLDDPAAVVRGAGAWAVQRLKGPGLASDRARRMACETDADVLSEWMPPRP